MDIVFVLGAGASHGEKLLPLKEGRWTTDANPPLLNGFFRKDLYASMGYPHENAKEDYSALFDFISEQWFPAGSSRDELWESLNIEDILTSIELDREFHGSEGDDGANLVLMRNSLLSYIRRIIGFCTENKYGEYTRQLADSVSAWGDNVITFNWDLLIDQELLSTNPSLYNNFLSIVCGVEEVVPSPLAFQGFEPALLKMHGSLNWFHCTNSSCPRKSTIEFVEDIKKCLLHNEGLGTKSCRRCGSEMIPLLIPPVLRKPVTENSIIRAIWGLARKRLETAKKVVLIGFSAAATDFYASWLLRSTLGVRKNVETFVVNPENENSEFRARMGDILLHGYNADFQRFEQISEILTAIGRPPREVPERPNVG